LFWIGILPRRQCTTIDHRHESRSKSLFSASSYRIKGLNELLSFELVKFNFAMSSLLDSVIPQPFSSDEAFAAFMKAECEFLAPGTSRTVYLVRGGRFVLKVAIDQAHRTCNWTEVAAYFGLGQDQDKLARVISWSNSGHFIVMERLDMSSRPPQDFPFPAWANDRKPSSVGKSEGGTYKMCDFAWVIPPDSFQSSTFR
jgi:hypothetical protein